MEENKIIFVGTSHGATYKFEYVENLNRQSNGGWTFTYKGVSTGTNNFANIPPGCLVLIKGGK